MGPKTYKGVPAESQPTNCLDYNQGGRHSQGKDEAPLARNC